VRDDVLVLETLLWPDEVRIPAFAFLDDDIDVRPQELRMAGSLIESMTVDFDPDEYHDSYREALQELVNAKVEGREVVQPETEEQPSGETSSLADALRASLAAARGGRLGTVAAAADGEEDEEEPARPRSSAARTRPAPSGSGKTGRAKTSTVKTGTARTSTAKTGTAKAAGSGSRAKTAAKTAAAEGPAKTGAKTAAPKGPAKTAATKRGAAAEEPAAAQRRPRRAS
jgi:DNA end-binding protein Ku